jgi:hypothetical protein
MSPFLAFKKIFILHNAVQWSKKMVKKWSHTCLINKTQIDEFVRQQQKFLFFSSSRIGLEKYPNQKKSLVDPCQLVIYI